MKSDSNLDSVGHFKVKFGLGEQTWMRLDLYVQLCKAISYNHLSLLLNKQRLENVKPYISWGSRWGYIPGCGVRCSSALELYSNTWSREPRGSIDKISQKQSLKLHKLPHPVISQCCFTTQYNITAPSLQNIKHVDTKLSKGAYPSSKIFSFTRKLLSQTWVSECATPFTKWLNATSSYHGCKAGIRKSKCNCAHLGPAKAAMWEYHLDTFTYSADTPFKAPKTARSSLDAWYLQARINTT